MTRGNIEGIVIACLGSLSYHPACDIDVCRRSTVANEAVAARKVVIAVRTSHCLPTSTSFAVLGSFDTCRKISFHSLDPPSRTTSRMQGLANITLPLPSSLVGVKSVDSIADEPPLSRATEHTLANGNGSTPGRQACAGSEIGREAATVEEDTRTGMETLADHVSARRVPAFVSCYGFCVAKSHYLHGFHAPNADATVL